MSTRAYRRFACVALAGCLLAVACFVAMPTAITFVPMVVASMAVGCTVATMPR